MRVTSRGAVSATTPLALRAVAPLRRRHPILQALKFMHQPPRTASGGLSVPSRIEIDQPPKQRTHPHDSVCPSGATSGIRRRVRAHARTVQWLPLAQILNPKFLSQLTRAFKVWPCGCILSGFRLAYRPRTTPPVKSTLQLKT